MSDILNCLSVVLLIFLFFTFPGVIVTRYLRAADSFSKIVVSIFVSIGFWICSSWFVSSLFLPLNFSAALMLLGFIVYFVVKHKFHPKDFISNIGRLKVRQIPIHYVALIGLIFCELTPIFFITIPPGCDTAMHGYITRLIINSNGLPHSYRPILPVDYFGSYSAGYHIFTALVSGLRVETLRLSIIFISVLVYPLTLLAFVFLLKNFFSERIATFTAILFFGYNRTFISTIDWGGNPTFLSFAFCLFSFGLIFYAVKNKSSPAFLLSSITCSAILLVHAIPAITFAYLYPPVFFLLMLQNRNSIKWLTLNTALMFVLAFLLLTPFLWHFRTENSPELIARIKEWQLNMMNYKLTGRVATDLLATAGQIMYRVGDELTIISCLTFVLLIFFRKIKVVLVILGFTAYIYVLVFNSGYWFLPVSELLYPERVVFFMIICWSFLFGFLITHLETIKTKMSVLKGRLNFYYLILAVTTYVSFENVVHKSIELSQEKQISCNKRIRRAFDWINKNTESNAIFEASYADAGMWIPTFTNRATLGTHMHFIHEIMHVQEQLRISSVPRYYFITKKDSEKNKEILNKLSVEKHVVFENEQVSIYH